MRTNLQALARAKGERIDDLTVVVLDRPRHTALIQRIAATDARLKLIPAGDVAAALMAAMPTLAWTCCLASTARPRLC